MSPRATCRTSSRSCRRGSSCRKCSAADGIKVGPIPAGTPVNLLANVNLLAEDPRQLPEYQAQIATLLVKVAGDLAALPNNATDEQARAAFRGPGDPLLALSKCPDFIVSNTSGNQYMEKLFTEELVAAAGSGSATLPDLLSEMLLAKVRALPDASADALRAAAVVGRPFDEAMLAAVLGGAEGDYLAPVRQAIDGQVLVADEAGYRFRHGLFAEAIVEDLTPGERRDLHGRIAAALEARPVPADGVRWVAGEAARHWQAADRPTEAYRSSIEAALAAVRAPRVHLGTRPLGDGARAARIASRPTRGPRSWRPTDWTRSTCSSEPRGRQISSDGTSGPSSSPNGRSAWSTRRATRHVRGPCGPTMASSCGTRVTSRWQRARSKRRRRSSGPTRRRVTGRRCWAGSRPSSSGAAGSARRSSSRARRWTPPETVACARSRSTRSGSWATRSISPARAAKRSIG